VTTSTNRVRLKAKKLQQRFCFLRQNRGCYCCDRKSRAAYAQSFALWQQATTEFTCYDYSPRTVVVTFNRSQVNIGRASTPRSLFYCLFAPHIYIFVLRAHPLHGESHNQRNTTGEVATLSSMRSVNRSRSVNLIITGAGAGVTF